MKQTVLAFLSIILEILLATVLFFLIIAVAHWLRVFLASMHEPEGSDLLLIAKGGELVLLTVDCVVCGLFVARGVYNAWRETWGREDE